MSSMTFCPRSEVIKLREQALGDRRIGTTGRGIGPCYEDKVARRGVLVADLLEPARLAVVTGYGGDLVRAALDGSGAVFIDQPDLLGTADAGLLGGVHLWRRAEQPDRIGTPSTS